MPLRDPVLTYLPTVDLFKHILVSTEGETAGEAFDLVVHKVEEFWVAIGLAYEHKLTEAEERIRDLTQQNDLLQTKYEELASLPPKTTRKKKSDAVTTAGAA